MFQAAHEKRRGRKRKRHSLLLSDKERKEQLEKERERGTRERERGMRTNHRGIPIQRSNNGRIRSAFQLFPWSMVFRPPSLPPSTTSLSRVLIGWNIGRAYVQTYVRTYIRTNNKFRAYTPRYAARVSAYPTTIRYAASQLHPFRCR